MSVNQFSLVSSYQPAGDQPKAIAELAAAINAGERHTTLMGVTGSGKTFTVAALLAQLNRPALIISHNKTLAAQLYGEFRGFFPQNAVEYFISYYDYYQPEAYLPNSDTYIEKDTEINDEINRLRLRATASLMERRDVVIVSSVSCIYGLGNPQDYRDLMLMLSVGDHVEREDILRRLTEIHYERNDMEFARGTYRSRGDTVEVFPAYEDRAFRIHLFGDEVEKIESLEQVTGNRLALLDRLVVYPAKHFVTPEERMKHAITAIEDELELRVIELRGEGKLLEAQRISQRTRFDLEMLREIGYCTGVENYSRHMAGRAPGSRPDVLIDYFPRDFLCIIDESHVTLPQVRGMFNGDRARKNVLVDYGFRLPSALDNRPLHWEEFEALIPQFLYLSATPGDYELQNSTIIEQIIRPTGLVDPPITVRPSTGQVDDLIGELRKRVAEGERCLVTTLTKRMSEDLSDYLHNLDFRVKYMHSEITSFERVEILRDLRLGKFDVLVGINLLREGLDLPEVTLVAILDADREGFLRNHRSLIQTAGRAARNVNGLVILYADVMTESIKRAIAECSRRRLIQQSYNSEHGIEPATVVKSIEEVLSSTQAADERQVKAAAGLTEFERENPEGIPALLRELEKEMKMAAEELRFEDAADIRDRIKEVRGEKEDAPQADVPYTHKKTRRKRW